MVDNSAMAAELPWELSTKARPELGSLVVVTRADAAEARTSGCFAKRRVLNNFIVVDWILFDDMVTMKKIYRKCIVQCAENHILAEAVPCGLSVFSLHKAVRFWQE
jgi:hypothetical protein